MFKNSYFKILLILVFLSGGLLAVQAQTAPVSGRVELKKNDGTRVPVQGALIESYRIDIKSTGPSDKTDKKGNFAFAGLPVGARYVLSVSAPGAKPGYYPNVKAGDDKLLITLEEGDGSKWTEAQVREALAGGNTNSGGSEQKASELTAEQKKQQAEYEQKVKEVTAKNEEIKNKTAVVQKSLEAGNAAFKAKDYNTAIASYTEGINADPEYVGSAPILLNNRGIVFKLRAIDEYNTAVKQSDAAAKSEGVAKAKKDLEDSLDSYTKSWTVIKNAPAADVQAVTTAPAAKYEALAGMTEIYRLLAVTKLNTAKAAESKEAFDEYLAVETDPAKKAKAQLTYADIMREAGDSEKAIAGYRAVLATAPDNAEAMAGLGLSLFNAGVVSSDKAQMQEGLNYMTKYIETSPIAPTDSASVKEFKQSVKDAVDYLKNTEKLAPQKVSAGAKKKN
jgi:tetratricopeptide (TPR) repeat protein